MLHKRPLALCIKMDHNGTVRSKSAGQGEQAI